MGHIVTQEDISILRQGEQEIRIKVELLNSDFKTLESLEGVIVSDNYMEDCESMHRRVYSCDMVILDSTFVIGKDKKSG